MSRKKRQKNINEAANTIDLIEEPMSTEISEAEQEAEKKDYSVYDEEDTILQKDTSSEDASGSPIEKLWDEETTPPKKAHGKAWTAMKITAVFALLIVGGTLLIHNIYYGNRWYKNTYINDVNVSGETLEESKKIILKKLDGYGLTITGRDNGSLTINGDDIDYELKINKSFDELFEKVHKDSALSFTKKELSVNYDVDYSEEKLNDLINNSDIVIGNDDYKIRKPKSASVKYSETKQQYECVKEEMGNTIIKASLIAAVKDALSKAETTLDINDTAETPSEHVIKDIYKAPRVTSDSPELQEQLNASNSAALRFIVWNMGKGVTEQITPAEISEWIRYSDGKIKYDWDKMSDWIEEFCLKYKTVGINRKVKMHNGKTVTVKGGDYGWQLDFEKTLKQAKKALQTDIEQESIDAYIENPSRENKAAITLKRKVQYANTAYKKDYENFKEDWDTENYIEISLARQKVYVIRNGKVKFSCKTISGRPTPDRATKKGAYFIKEHNLERTLVGEDYQTPVKNWVRITWSGTGFHSATWQPWSSWTKDLYKTRGSHGCLNLSLEDSQKIYNLSKYREAVFIY